MSYPTVLVFTKPPRMGLSKTRLARDIGPTEARRIARFTLSRTMQAAVSPAWRTELHITPPAALDETLGGLWPAHLPRRAQAPGTLGERLTHAMMTAPRGPVIFIGTDTPDISRAHIREAARQLGGKRAVAGPARDGGFWLLGLPPALRHPDLFSNVRWSTRHALKDVRKNLPVEGDVFLLDTLVDIDTGKDWKLYKKQY